MHSNLSPQVEEAPRRVPHYIPVMEYIKRGRGRASAAARHSSYHRSVKISEECPVLTAFSHRDEAGVRLSARGGSPSPTRLRRASVYGFWAAAGSRASFSRINPVSSSGLPRSATAQLESDFSTVRTAIF